MRGLPAKVAADSPISRSKLSYRSEYLPYPFRAAVIASPVARANGMKGLSNTPPACQALTKRRETSPGKTGVSAYSVFTSNENPFYQGSSMTQ